MLLKYGDGEIIFSLDIIFWFKDYMLIKILLSGNFGGINKSLFPSKGRWLRFPRRGKDFKIDHDLQVINIYNWSYLVFLT